METRAHYVLIGTFVLVATVAAAAFVLWLGQVEREFDRYRVVFDDRVSGLSTGAAVQFNGIQVGEVNNLRLDRDNPNRVLADIRVSKDTPIKPETRASLEVVGVTGLAIIQFEGGEPASPLLKDSVDGLPVIFADESEIQVFIDTSEDILTAINEVLSAQNRENISAIIANMRALTSTAAMRSDDLGAAIDSLTATAARLSTAAESLESAATAAETVLTGEGAAAVAEARLASAEVKALAASLNALVENNSAAIAAFSQDGLGQAAPALAEARDVMAALDRLLAEIERDPSSFFFGETRPTDGDRR
ncbi:MAG: MlaD family protein [Pseudomonadota bacterium]